MQDTPKMSRPMTSFEALCKRCNMITPKITMEHEHCYRCRMILEERGKMTPSVAPPESKTTVTHSAVEGVVVETKDPCGYMVYERMDPAGKVFIPAMDKWRNKLFPTLLMAREAAIESIAKARVAGSTDWDHKDIAILIVYKDRDSGVISWPVDIGEVAIKEGQVGMGKQPEKATGTHD